MTCVASGGDTAPGRPAAALSANVNTGAEVMCHCSEMTKGML